MISTPRTPLEIEEGRLRRNRYILLTAMGLVAGVMLWTRFVLGIPEDYTSLEEHFKYGSIGADVDNGLPYWIWKVMPTMCPDHLEVRGDGSHASYEAFGFIQEPEHDRPVGFSKRRVNGIEMVGLNCAGCHAGTIRKEAAEPAQLILTMPAHQMDLLSYFEFLFDCAQDSKFTVDNVMAHVDTVTKLSMADRFIYRAAVPIVRETLLARAGRVAPLRSDRFRSGKGRIDTFNPYKAMVLNFPEVERAAPGASDLPSIWNQGIRREMHLHWDGNNDSLFERNISAAIGAGVTPESVDLYRIERIAKWLQQVKPPENPLLAGDVQLGKGKHLYAMHCGNCHGEPDKAFQGGAVGKVIPVDEIGTDPARWQSYTYAFAGSQWTIGTGHEWRFKHFRKTPGYANMPLDGVWARAPYLHNGSVPTLRDLLAKPSTESDDVLRARAQEIRQGVPKEVERKVRTALKEAREKGERPILFYRGYDVLDAENVGFRADVAQEKAKRFYLYDTTYEGRGNAGHDYGTALPEPEKAELLAYLKTL